MTSKLPEVEALNLDNMSAQVDGEGTVRLRGSMSMRSPSDTLRPFLREVHAAAVADAVKELQVDLTELAFMNSSSIRVLVSWMDWIAREPAGKRYVIHFRTSPDATWQKTSLTVLSALAEDRVRVTPKSRT